MECGKYKGSPVDVMLSLGRGVVQISNRDLALNGGRKRKAAVITNT